MTIDENKPNNKKHRFQQDNKLFTLCIYIVATFTACLFIFKFVNNWGETRSTFAGAIDTLSPFLIAFFIAYLVNPLVKFIDRLLFGHFFKNKFTRIHKFVSLLIAYVLIIGVIVLLLSFIVPQIVTNIIDLVKQSPDMYTTAVDFAANLKERYPMADLSFLDGFIDNTLPNLINYISSTTTTLLPKLYSTGMSIITWFVNIIIAFIVSCYIMSDKRRILHGMKKIIYAIFPEHIAFRIVLVLKQSNQIFSGFIIGKVIDSLIIGIICFVAMLILRLPYALLLSIIVGITNMIPYFGPFIGAVPGAVIMLIIDPFKALVFLLMILALQQFDGNILGPKILGDSTGLSPIWIIFAIIVGGSLAGPIGMFLGVPVTAVLVHLLDDIIDYVLYKRHLNTDLSNIQVPNVREDNIFIQVPPEETKTSSEN